MTQRQAALVRFDDASINWRRLGEFEHFHYTIIDVDPDNEIADFALRFVPGERIFLHRHRAHTNTTVVQGEHRIYEPAGDLREVRPQGSYTSSPAAPDPHAEGGGADGAIVVYQTRGSADGVVFDVLDDAHNVVGTLGVGDLAQLFELQGHRPGA
jgi:hypothetical protein